MARQDEKAAMSSHATTVMVMLMDASTEISIDRDIPASPTSTARGRQAAAAKLKERHLESSIPILVTSTTSFDY